MKTCVRCGRKLLWREWLTELVHKGELHLFHTEGWRCSDECVADAAAMDPDDERKQDGEEDAEAERPIFLLSRVRRVVAQGSN